MVTQRLLDPGTRPRGQRDGMRRGISLIEVLISMFILLFGLLGIAAMFPAGQYHASRAIRFDRTAAIGQAAFNDIRVRGLLRPEVWLDLGQNPVPEENLNDPFMIDPLGVGAARSVDPSNPDANMGTFPYGSDPMLFPPRLTVPDATSTDPPVAMDLAIAEQVFTSRDDLVIEFPSDRDEPSQPMYHLGDGSEVALADVLPTSNAAYRSFAADYSWMFMAVPVIDVIGNATGKYTVSVIVFYKRNSSDGATSERLVTVAPTPLTLPSRWGGGEVQLVADSREALEMAKPGGWLMLSGWIPANPPTTPEPTPVYKWYRIVAADEIDGDGSEVTRFVSLKGPDWDERANQNVVQATLVDGVVAVYEKIMSRDDTSSPWAILQAP